MKILIVEDNDLELKLAHIVLAGSGHEVFDANGAWEALVIADANKPEIILVDLGLPGRDGLQLASYLKNNPATSNIPVVGITSFPERYTKSMALNAGCDHYIEKPLDTRLISAQLQDILRRHLLSTQQTAKKVT